ncbi:DUF1871 family protein [Planococcus donghaensis]|uniref:DUF1871 domain-containing protein n=1 Tax=Planococcus donghaensis TaxID=414778 RepID=A0A1C7EKC8_9BACL|nr:DUF1871 family protein [Planococcus donghaensis]ANU23792.1 hypothetical protein BCM40_10635 [Planococcus donghaensis]
MDINEMNRKAITIMKYWDPFAIGSESYGQEIGNVITQLQVLDDPSDLAKTIQMNYEYSFGKWIPLEQCVDISYKLIALKFKAKHII